MIEVVLHIKYGRNGKERRGKGGIGKIIWIEKEIYASR